MLIYPLRKLWISADTIDHQYNAYDWGWFSYDESMPEDSGRNPRLYSMADGIVVGIVNSHDDEPDMNGYGNTITIKYPSEVKVGDRLTQGQTVCRMGNSGYSFGNHLHLEVCKGQTFVRHGGVDYVKQKIVYATNWHYVDSDTQRDYNIAHMVIEPNAEDIAKNQVHVFGNDLRIRKAPATGEVVGFAQQGYYDFTETVEQGEYIWAHVGDYWMAANTDVSELLMASFAPIEANPDVNQAEVLSNDLRIRFEPSTSSKILGYAPKGFYDIEESRNESDYLWFKVCGAWIACTDDVLYHAAQGDEKDKKIKELEEKVSELEGTIVLLNNVVKTQNEEINRLKNAIRSIEIICEGFEAL